MFPGADNLNVGVRGYDFRRGVSTVRANFFKHPYDVGKFGDFRIVWTNKDYRMIYLNMGHGDEEFIDANQNLLITNAFRWIVSCDPKGNPFLK